MEAVAAFDAAEVESVKRLQFVVVEESGSLVALAVYELVVTFEVAFVVEFVEFVAGLDFVGFECAVGDWNEFE